MASLKRIIVGYRGKHTYFLTANNRWARKQSSAATFNDDTSTWDAMTKASKWVTSKTWLWATIVSVSN